MSFSDFSILLCKEEVLVEKSIILREILIITENNEIRITQLHSICWPDYLTPDEELGYKMIEFLMMFVNDFREKYKYQPVLLHCR